MKKKYLAIFSVFIISCVDSHKVSKEHKNISFEKVVTDTLVPINGGAYSAQLIKLNGYVHDSIYVSFGNDTYKQYFTGKLDTTIWGGDYYGGQKAIFIFDPYKAKSGKLNVEFIIN